MNGNAFPQDSKNGLLHQQHNYSSFEILFFRFFFTIRLMATIKAIRLYIQVNIKARPNPILASIWLLYKSSMAR